MTGPEWELIRLLDLAEGAVAWPGGRGDRSAHTWKRSGGTCLFTRWPWTCSVALFEKGWGRQR